MTLISNDKVM